MVYMQVILGQVILNNEQVKKGIVKPANGEGLGKCKMLSYIFYIQQRQVIEIKHTKGRG